MPRDRTITPPDPTVPPPDLVRRHLDDLLASPHFRNSKRSQLLLKYVVGAYLEGSLDRVKERIIGQEAFHREPDYDTNQDSVVRTTAAEVRKRLAQYYQDPGHETEIRLVLPQGSYAPDFRLSPAMRVTAAPGAVEPGRARPLRWATGVGLAFAVIASGVYVIAAMRASALDRFWMPLLDDPAEAVICIEQPLRIYRFVGPRTDDLNQAMVGSPATPFAPADSRKDSAVQLSELLPTGEQYFTYGDLMASVRLGEMFSRRRKPFQVLGDRLTSYKDLRGRPAVLIGQFNNVWTNGLTSGLRYYLGKTTAAYEVRDRQGGDKVIASLARLNRAEDYAIISRILDVTTEKTVVAVSATTFFGTLAAGDFLTHNSYMQEAFQSAPAKWWKKDVQVVIRSRMIGGMPGPPKMVALHLW